MEKTGGPSSARLRKTTIQVIVIALCGAVAYAIDGWRGLALLLIFATVNLGLSARARRLRG